MPPTPPSRSTIRRLYALLWPQRATIGLGMLLLLGSVAAELYPPLVWGQVVDVGLARGDWNFVAWQLALLVGVYAVQQLLSAFQGLLLERAGQQLALELRLKLYKKLAGQSAAYFEGQRTSDLLARLTADVDGIQDVLLRGINTTLGNALRLVGVIGIFIALQPLLGAVVVLPMIAVALLLTRYYQQEYPDRTADARVRSAVGPRDPGRPRRAGPDAALAAPRRRRDAAGHLSVLRHRAGKRALRLPRCHAR